MTVSRERKNISWPWWWIVAGLFLWVLLRHSAQYYPFIADDALISLRYAERFLQGDGLTWTTGEWVEGYSNLAWILAISFLGFWGVDLIDATRILGFVSVAIAFWALARTLKPQAHFHRFSHKLLYLLPWLGALAVLCASPPLAVWVIGGLEQSLFMACLLLYYADALAWLDTKSKSEDMTSLEQTPHRAKIPKLYISAMAGVVLCLTRPDGPLFVALWFAFYLAYCFFTYGKALIQPLKSASPLVTWPLFAFVGQILFRLYYYGDWVPNTAHLKVSISEQTWTWGQTYWQEAWTIIGVLVWPALLSLNSKRRLAVGLIWTSILAWVAYVWLIGGDIFPGHRHAVVICALGSLLVLIGLESFKSWFLRSLGLALSLGVGALSIQASQAPITEAQAYRNAKLERWEWHGKIIGEWLGNSFGKQDPLLAVTAAGTLPYFSKLRALDMQGLNDRHIAQTKAQANYILAHNHGDGDYVLSRKPDLLAFRGVGLGRPAFVSGDQMKTKREFITRYRLRTFEGQFPQYVKSQLYIRLDGALGIQKRNVDEVYLPSYLFRNIISLPGPTVRQKTQLAHQKPMSSHDIRSNKPKPHSKPIQTQVPSSIVSRWPIEEMVHLTNFPMPAGKWHVELDPPQSIKLKNYAQQSQRSTTLGIQVLSGHEALSSPAPKTYQRDHEVLVKGVRFKRVGDADYPQFVVSAPSIEQARQNEMKALQDPFLIKLNDFESPNQANHLKTAMTNKLSSSLWQSAWQSSSSTHRQQGLSPVIQSGTAKRQNKVRGFGGKSLINTFHTHSGDRFTIQAWSPVMTLPSHSILSFKVGGGKLGRRVGLRIWINGIALGTWAGNDSERLRQVHLDLSLYEGQDLQLELFDKNQGTWGHLLLDDIWLSNHLLLAREEVSKQAQ